jgi:murein DD-endopeptidase MepM/ murein hydrolase activator NlpD
MTEKKSETRTHTVVAGESFGSVSTDFNMTQDELLALNPSLSKDNVKTLQIGQEIKVSVKVPVVAIKSTQTVTTEEEIPYSSEIVENNNEQKTYRKVITEGVNGKKQVTEEVTYVNGLKSDTKVTNEKIITEAVNEKVEVGTLGEEAKPASGSFIFPVTGTISSVFGPRDYGNGKHFGIDIAAGAGNPVHAADTGTVTFAGWNSGGYGNLVIIDHGNGFVTYYAHNSQLCVKKGDKVNQGTTIALVGTTGDSTGNHCHFEVVHNGQKVDPFNYLSMN